MTAAIVGPTFRWAALHLCSTVAGASRKRLFLPSVIAARSFVVIRRHEPCCRFLVCDAALTSFPQNRPFSRSSGGEVERKDRNGSDVAASADSRSVLYCRSPSRRTFPRFLLGMTTLHTSYWAWYVLDFTPTMNAAAAERVSLLAAKGGAIAESAAAAASGTVDPTIGYVGLGLAIMMSALSVMYPRHLISEVRVGDAAPGSIRIKVHDLPLVTVPRGEGTLYTKGTALIDNAADVNTILNDRSGDIASFRGHLGVNASGSRGNLLLNIGEGDIVKKGDVLLKALLPAGMKVPVQHSEMGQL